MRRRFKQSLSIQMGILNFIRAGYGYLLVGTSPFQSIFLLIIRLYWGWQFCSTGFGKLTHIDKIVGFFSSLGIPLPELNAYLAGTTECVGGFLLLVGLGSRVIAIPLIFTMIVAYATAERDAVRVIFTDPDKFTSADPFLFLLTAVIVLLFGPGKISVDAILESVLGKETKDSPRAAATPAPSA
jgi:putative oxidoreductase